MQHVLKIVAGSDFHYPRRVQSLESLERMAATDADVLVLAGDMVDAFEPVRLMEVFQATKAFPGPRLYVWGNHELWSRKTAADKLHREVLPALAHEAGFHCPETDGPLWIGSVAFVGVMGWYDYGYAPGPEAPDAEIVEASIEAKKLKLRRTGRSLADLTSREYARKAVAWYEDGRVRSARWSDGKHVQWDRDDHEVVRQSCRRLEEQLEEVHEAATSVVAITHMVPEAAGLHPGEDVWRAWIRAYMGTPRLGELLRSYDKARTWLFGHCHRGRSFATAGGRAYNVASPSGEPTVIKVGAG